MVGAGAVWFAVQVRQVSERNPLARLGDYTYGLYLVHVPLMFAVFYPAVMRRWALTPEQVVLVAGAVAVTGGLLFGRLESAVHTRLRPLAKMRLKLGSPVRWVESLVRLLAVVVGFMCWSFRCAVAQIGSRSGSK